MERNGDQQIQGEVVDAVATLSDEELQVVLRLVASQLPPVLAMLNEVGVGWKGLIVLTAYLLNAALLRHPEYAANVEQLMPAFAAWYSAAEADFASGNPAQYAQSLEDDEVVVLVPGEDSLNAIRKH